MLGGSDQIKVFTIVPAFQRDCIKNGIHKEAALCIFHFFMNTSPGELEVPLIKAELFQIEATHVRGASLRSSVNIWIIF